MSLLEHIEELRRRAIHWTWSYLLCAAPMLYFSQELYTLFAHPFLAALPNSSTHIPLLIATTVTSPFITPIILALWLSLFLSMPIAFYHLWRFIAPALYQHESQPLFLLLIVSILLFYTGLAFSFFIVCPAALTFFMQVTPDSIHMMTDIQSYLDFMLKLLFAFGLGFQMPLISFMLARHNLLSKNRMRHLRPYLIITAFTMAMLLTPPDVISQTCLALPLWLLFEIGAFFGHSKIAKSSGTSVR
jgi:sec-independent protein translocase protein TatC